MTKYKCFIVIFALFFISEKSQAARRNQSQKIICVKALIEDEKDINAKTKPLYRAIANVSRSLFLAALSKSRHSFEFTHSVQQSLSRMSAPEMEAVIHDIIRNSENIIRNFAGLTTNPKELLMHNPLSISFTLVAMAIAIEYNMQDSQDQDHTQLHWALANSIRISFATTSGSQLDKVPNILKASSQDMISNPSYRALYQLQMDLADVAIASLAKTNAVQDDDTYRTADIDIATAVKKLGLNKHNLQQWYYELLLKELQKKPFEEISE